jgi:hypothetical protein
MNGWKSNLPQREVRLALAQGCTFLASTLGIRWVFW